MKTSKALALAIPALLAASLAFPRAARSAPPQSLLAHSPQILLLDAGPIPQDEALQGVRILGSWMRRDLAAHWHLLPIPIRMTLASELPAFCSSGAAACHGPGAQIWVRIPWDHFPGSWFFDASHELAEATANPDLTAAFPEPPNGGFVRVEIADPVETQGYFFADSGLRIWVTDFIYPAYYNRLSKGPFDFNGAITSPLVPAIGCPADSIVDSNPPNA